MKITASEKQFILKRRVLAINTGWLKQERSNVITYALVVGLQKNNKQIVIAIDDDRKVAVITNTGNWYPLPVSIDELDVPAKIKNKNIKEKI